jgi:hypothetical protein
MQLSFKRALPVFVGVLVFSLMSIGSAFAAGKPEFKPGKAEKFTGKLSKTSWSANNGAIAMACTGGTGNGEILTATTAGKFVATFTGCVASGPDGNNCPARSAGQPEGQVVTEPLTAELGTVATSEAASGVGLLIGKASSEGIATVWTYLEGNNCWPEEHDVRGDLAAEVKVIGKKQVSNELVFSKNGALYNKIKKITLDSGKVVEPDLLWGSYRLSMEGLDELTFPEATEVT